MLVVDAANVVGSRPDGWWRDRAAAAARLVAQLAALRPPPDAQLDVPGPDVPGPDVLGPDVPGLDAAAVRGVVVVLEGRARDGHPEGVHGGGRVQVRHAPGSGDELLAELAAPGVVLVTADRALAARARARGASVVGPRRLLDRLAPAAGARSAAPAPVELDAAQGQQHGQQPSADDGAVGDVEAGPDLEVQEVDDGSPPRSR